MITIKLAIPIHDAEATMQALESWLDALGSLEENRDQAHCVRRVLQQLQSTAKVVIQ